MTDIFRQELDIPEKRTTFGWILFVMGGVMIFIAAVIFIQDANFKAKIDERPWEKHISAPFAARADNATSDKAAAARAKAERLLFMVVAGLGIVMAFVIIATLSHRAAERLRASSNKPLEKTKFTDPWKESANRIRVDPEEEK